MSEQDKKEQGQAPASKQETRPSTDESSATPVYHTYSNGGTVRIPAIDLDDFEKLYEHMRATMEMLGIKWLPDQPLAPGIIAIYNREQTDATLLVSAELPCGQSAEHGGGTELTLIAKAIAVHLANAEVDPCANVQVVFTWDLSKSNMCYKSCSFTDSLNHCDQCQMKGACRLLKAV